MEVVGSAVGIVSLGLQTCQGLLKYYDDWKGYKSDVQHAHASVADLEKTLLIIQYSLRSEQQDAAGLQVQSCVLACQAGLDRLSARLEKLRTYEKPDGFREKAWSEIQRVWYPLRANTLSKLKKCVDDVRMQLQLAVDALQLDSITKMQHVLKTVDNRTTELETKTVQLIQGQRSDQFEKIIDWLAPSDPWVNHIAARQKHEPHTGNWLLQSHQYQAWKAGKTRHIWLHGKAGCGKTVLCSTIIEDIKVLCNEQQSDARLAVFYMSFSDSGKQSYQDLLHSLLAQLTTPESSATAMLREHYSRPMRTLPGLQHLEEILLKAIDSLSRVYICVDALDESPEADETRQSLLDRLEALVGKASNIGLLATSRDVLDVRECVEAIQAADILIDTDAINQDIDLYVVEEIARHRPLSRLNSDTKELVRRTLSQKADGMFRWAYCQLLELKKLKSYRPSFVAEALKELPNTLDDTYTRMLTEIEDTYRDDALTLLRWLAYARMPMTLGELAEAVLIDLDRKTVAFHDRGDLEGPLRILSGLIVITRATTSKDGSGRNQSFAEYKNEVACKDSCYEDNHTARWQKPKVRLAHFSVKEFLESSRILDTPAKQFRLAGITEHQQLSDGCIAYLLQYNDDSSKSCTTQDLDTYPLLLYASESWYRHLAMQPSASNDAAVQLLTSRSATQNWLRVFQPDQATTKSFLWPAFFGSGLYYASTVGLTEVVRSLIELGSDIHENGGAHQTALLAAAINGHNDIVKLLLQHGANASTIGGIYGGDALHEAAAQGHENVVLSLIEHKVDVNAQSGTSGTALQMAVTRGQENIIEVLLRNGADPYLAPFPYGYAHALENAAIAGRLSVVRLLLRHGVAIDAPGRRYRSASHAAHLRGFDKIVQLLRNSGASDTLEDCPEMFGVDADMRELHFTERHTEIVDDRPGEWQVQYTRRDYAFLCPPQR